MHQTIYFPEVKALHIALPDQREQGAIATVLSALDDKIELNRRMNETLEALAQAIFKDWFVTFGPTRRKMDGATDAVAILGGLIAEPAKAARLAALFPDSFGEDGLPEGWEEATLDAVCTVNDESWKTSNHPDKVTYVDLSNTKWGVIEAINILAWKDAPSRARRIARPGDTIVGTVRPGNGSYAFISDEGYTASTGFAVLRPKLPEYASFVYIASTRPENIERLANLADSHGGAYPAVNPNEVTSTKIAFPGEPALLAFDLLAGPFRDRIEHNKQENRILANTRDYLLPKLMSGTVRVRDAESRTEVDILTSEPVEETSETVVAFPTDLLGEPYLTPEQDTERDAVMVTSIVMNFRDGDTVVGNVKVQKGCYFIRRRMGISVQTFEKQAAGPYDQTLNHEGGRGEALSRKWIGRSSRATSFGNVIAGNVPGAKAHEAQALVKHYRMDDAINWVTKHFAAKTRDELECLATVDFAMQSLLAKRIAVSVETVKADITSDPVWKLKLTKPHFSDDRISASIAFLGKLFDEGSRP